MVASGGMLFNGTYTLVATDTAGNSNTASCTISGIGINGSNAVNVVGAYNQDRNNGSVSIDEDKVTGGMFVVMPSQTSYYGSYEYSLQPADDAFCLRRYLRYDRRRTGRLQYRNV